MALTWVLAVALGACSSKKSASEGDGGSNDAWSRDTTMESPDTQPTDRYRPGDAIEGPVPGEVGSDVRDTAPAREVAVDVRDAITRDAREGDAGKETQGADARDAASTLDAKSTVMEDGAVTADVQAGKDSPSDTSKDTKGDTADTTVRDAPPEVAANSCSSPIVIDTDVAHVDIPLSTTGGGHRFDLSCAQGGNDIVLRFSVFERELVYADTFGATWDTILSLSPACPAKPMNGTPEAGMSWCSDNACGGKQSQITAVLTSGLYYLIVSGANGESGDVTLHFQHTPVGNGPLVMVPAGAGTYNGATQAGSLGSVDMCESPGPDNSYWWLTCPDYVGGALAASTCEGTSFDTVVNLQIPRTNLSSCNDDSEDCGVKTRSSLKSTVPAGAGINVVTVDGSMVSSSGAYRLTLTRP